MSFGAPAVLQCLMQNVLSNLNIDADKEFVDVSFDDIIIFSENLSEHLNYLRNIL